MGLLEESHYFYRSERREGADTSYSEVASLNKKSPQFTSTYKLDNFVSTVSMQYVHKMVANQVVRATKANNRKQYGLHIIEVDVSSLLLANILAITLPPKSRIPQIAEYYGKTDPRDHIRTHDTLMLGRRATDDIRCILFSGTLKGMAPNWFHSLEPWSITSFA